MHFNEADLAEVQACWPRLRRRPSRDPHVAELMGVFDFTMEPEGRIRITDHYRIRLLVPMAPTYALPRAYEEQGRIRREADWHMYPTGEMCLGSPLRVLQILGPQPSLMRFVTQCVAPFLYAASWRELGHEGYPFLDLAHGAAGLVDDYERLFGLEGRDQIVAALHLLGMRRRVANKRPCPCGCGARLGRCALRARLAPWRPLTARRVYSTQARWIASEGTSQPKPLTAALRAASASIATGGLLLTAWNPKAATTFT